MHAPKQASVRVAVAGEVLDLHCRMLGSGPALLMLHPSPLSSAFMVPFMRRFAHRATIIAPDTPGFGRSTGFAGDVRDLTPYVEAMRALVRAFGIERYAVYGSATGAQIAIELAKADETRVTGAILDNVADFTDEESERIMDGYFPDVSPDESGSHLARIWQVAHDSTLFFPWHFRGEQYRIASEPGSPAAMQATASGYLEAGEGYDKAYRAAFQNERAPRLQAVTAPVSIIRWQDSILKPYSDRLDEYTWDANHRMVHCAQGMEARLEAIEAEFGRVLAAEDANLSRAGASWDVPAPALADLSGAPDLTPETSGAHLWRAWYWLRGRHLTPDDDLPDARALNQSLIQLMRPA